MPAHLTGRGADLVHRRWSPEAALLAGSNFRTLAVALALFACSAAVLADGGHQEIDSLRADAHAPIGVMGEHAHAAGEWMLSYRYLRMRMRDNRKGRDDLSPEQIAGGEPNPFAPPETLRVVPLDMSMEMHMFGLMYAPSDKVTLMLMVPEVELTMDHVTFQGASGTTRLGEFTTGADGLGDISLVGLFSLPAGADQRFLVRAGFSAPTGAVDDRDQVLAPNGNRPTLRLPYPMQIGSGTWEFLNGLTWAGHRGAWGYGVQYAGTWRLGRNDEGYSLGDVQEFSAWGSYQWVPELSVSLRLVGRDNANVDGRDPAIAAPVQTADPDRQGGTRVDAGIGLNLAGSFGHRLALEWLAPVYQDLDGPQLKLRSTLVAGYQYNF